MIRTLVREDDTTHLVFITGAVGHIITALLEDSVGSYPSHHSIEGLLCFGEVGRVPSCGIQNTQTGRNYPLTVRPFRLGQLHVNCGP